MASSFGPQLIGQAEKALQALLLRLLDGTGLEEPHWVTLRLAGQVGSTVDPERLVAVLRARTPYPDPAGLVDQLTGRGLLLGGVLTERGRSLVADVQARIDELTAPLWQDLPTADLETTTRVLTQVTARARAALA